ncbi:MAG: transposase [Candidatus Obscuribacterales bacterium]|jgi:transposase-like protein
MAKSKNFSEQHRVGKVKEFIASGLTANEFCRQHGISNSTFSVWRRKLTPRKIADRNIKVSQRSSAKHQQL